MAAATCSAESGILQQLSNTNGDARLVISPRIIYSGTLTELVLERVLVERKRRHTGLSTVRYQCAVAGSQSGIRRAPSPTAQRPSWYW